MVRHSLKKFALVVALLVGVGSVSADAAEPGVLVWGDIMTPGADPHAVSETPMWFIANNLYDNLYRYANNPPILVP